MWDAVVVGARCAGATTALLLARQGHRVLLMDRAKFPSDTMSTLFIHQPGISRLERWGLLDAVISSGCPRIENVTYMLQDVALRAALPALGNINFAYAPRRYILDQLLITAAVDAGADLAQECPLSEILSEGDGRVSGVRFRTPAGTMAAEKSRLVIGADGMRSKVAQLVGSPVTINDPLATCIYYSGWAGLGTGFEMRERQGRWLATIPTNDGVTLILTYFPQQEFAVVKNDPYKNHLAAIQASAPEVFDQLATSDQVVRLHGTGDQRNFFRQPWGPGWALVGDAGHHEDSITARGITNAFIQAELLCEEVAGNLDSEKQLATALSRFSERRDAALIGTYRSTLETAQLQVQKSRVEMLRKISEIPELTQRYFALAAGIIPMDEFLTPELVAMLSR
jgi:2-polyprenyl-6-methoxyphenol hydroxylase-like FAD-dependent oxidoreductase